MDELERQREIFERAMDEMSRDMLLTSKTFDELNNSTKSFGTSLKDAERKLNEWKRSGWGQFAAAVGDVSKGFIQTAQASRENRESFESLNPAIRGAANALRRIPLFGDALGDSFEDVGTFITAELQRTVTSFNTLGSVGALGAEGMTGMIDQSIKAGLSLEQFAKVIVSNGKALAFSTGNSLEGAKAIAQITQEVGNTGLRRQFRALGIGLEEQSTAFADYLEFTTRIGVRQTRDYRSQAAAAGEYLLQLDRLARVTGQTREQAQQALESSQADARFLAAQRRAQRNIGGELGATVAKRMVDAVEIIRSRAPELAEPIMDAFSGPNTKAAQKFLLQFGNEGQAALDALQTGRMTEYQFVETIQRLAVNAENRLGPMIGVLSKTGTEFEGTLLGIQQLSSTVGLTEAELKKLAKTQGDARKTQDKNTDNVIDAAESLQKFAQQMDAFVAQNVLPTATTAVQKFTGGLDKLAEKINEFTGVRPQSATPLPEIIPDGAATGGPITRGDPFVVGELGPELVIPNTSSTVIPADQLVAMFDQVQKMGQASMLVDGFSRTFMPGVGYANRMTAEGLDVTKITDFAGAEIAEKVSYSLDTMLGSMSGTATQYTAGPRESYANQIFGQDMVSAITMGEFGGKKSTVYGEGDMMKNEALFKEMTAALTAELRSIAVNTKLGADTSKKLLRAQS